MSRPMPTKEASAKRSASVPYVSSSPSGSMTLPFDLLIFRPSGSRRSPRMYTSATGTSPGRERRTRERLDLDEPLPRDERLDDGPAAVADADAVAVRLLALEETHRAEVLDDALPALEAVEAGVAARFRRHATVGANDRAEREPVALPHLPVRRIVRRRDLDHAGAERRVDGGVGDDGKLERARLRVHGQGLPDEMTVARVVGMDRERRVAELRFRPHGRDRHGPVADVVA